MIHECEKRPDPFAANTHSARWKNAAPAYRRWHGRGGPHPHGLSQASAAFCPTAVSVLRRVFSANGSMRFERREQCGPSSPRGSQRAIRSMSPSFVLFVLFVVPSSSHVEARV
jgi:hypothetical protein